MHTQKYKITNIILYIYIYYIIQIIHIYTRKGAYLSLGSDTSYHQTLQLAFPQQTLQVRVRVYDDIHVTWS